VGFICMNSFKNLNIKLQTKYIHVYINQISRFQEFFNRALLHCNDMLKIILNPSYIYKEFIVANILDMSFMEIWELLVQE